MTYDLAAWAVLAFWIGFRVVLPLAGARAAIAGGALTALAGVALPVVAPLMVAVFAPFGILLPALALRDVVGRLGGAVMRFHPTEITVVLGLGALYIAASIGVFPIDPYRWGYGVLVPGIVALVGILWSLWRRHFIVTGAILVAQIVWAFGGLSPNFFDLIFHALLEPVCAVWLVKWGILRLTNPRSRVAT